MTDIDSLTALLADCYGDYEMVRTNVGASGPGGYHLTVVRCAHGDDFQNAAFLYQDDLLVASRLNCDYSDAMTDVHRDGGDVGAWDQSTAERCIDAALDAMSSLFHEAEAA